MFFHRNVSLPEGNPIPLISNTTEMVQIIWKVTTEPWFLRWCFRLRGWGERGKGWQMIANSGGNQHWTNKCLGVWGFQWLWPMGMHNGWKSGNSHDLTPETDTNCDRNQAEGQLDQSKNREFSTIWLSKPGGVTINSWETNQEIWDFYHQTLEFNWENLGTACMVLPCSTITFWVWSK